MSKQTRWLFAEIDRWTQQEIITDEQAVRVRALYPESVGRTSWGLLLFSGLGVVVIGLGVILLLAYNWKEIPKFGKLALVFGSIIAAHVGGLYLRWKERPQPEIGEALSLLGTMLFGAGIWLVAQIYHIDEHFPNGFLIWGLGALLLTWALDSVPQAIVATLALTAWGCSELLRFDAPADFGTLLLLGGIAPFAWRRRSALLTAILLAASYLTLACHASYWNGSGGAFTLVFSLSVLLIAAVRLRPADQSATRLFSVVSFFGWSGFIVCAYILSFEDAVRDLLRWNNHHASSPVALIAHRWVFFALAVVAWGFVAVKKWGAQKASVAFEEWLCPIALIYCQGLAVAGFYGDALFVALVFNFVCLGVAVLWMVRGCREGKLRSTVLGSVVFAALVFARYFDLFDSLAVRGVVFLILGGVLFAEGFYYRRLRISHADERSGS